MSAPLKCPQCQQLLRRQLGPAEIATTFGDREVVLILEDAPVWHCPGCDYQLCDEECMQRRRASYRAALDSFWWNSLRDVGAHVAETMKLRQLFVRVAATLGGDAAAELGKWLGRDLKVRSPGGADAAN